MKGKTVSSEKIGSPASHTPGPWIIITSDAAHDIVVDSRTESNIIYGPFSPDFALAVANSKLISAAPDLLASARQALEALSCTCSPTKPAPAAFCDCFTCEAAKALQAAIRKAVNA